uniref:LisH domain-containing protein n=1 Tax=Mesocestoides corti TaxID=53468 RepID=A0A5K3FQL2_MESCO
MTATPYVPSQAASWANSYASLPHMTASSFVSQITYVLAMIPTIPQSRLQLVSSVASSSASLYPLQLLRPYVTSRNKHYLLQFRTPPLAPSINLPSATPNQPIATPYFF